MQTTLQLDEGLLLQAQAYAEQTGRTLDRVVEDALRSTLGADHRPAQPPSETGPAFPTFRLGPSAVDLSDSRAVRDRLDEQAPGGFNACN